MDKENECPFNTNNTIILETHALDFYSIRRNKHGRFGNLLADKSFKKRSTFPYIKLASASYLPEGSVLSQRNIQAQIRDFFASQVPTDYWVPSEHEDMNEVCIDMAMDHALRNYLGQSLFSLMTYKNMSTKEDNLDSKKRMNAESEEIEETQENSVNKKVKYQEDISHWERFFDNLESGTFAVEMQLFWESSIQCKKEKSYLVAGLYSDNYKSESSIQNESMGNLESVEKGFKFELPMDLGETLLNTCKDFELPRTIIQESKKASLNNSFIKIKSNIFVDRKPKKVIEHPKCVCITNCGDECLNRCMFIECHPDHCPTGSKCTNQEIQSRKWIKELKVLDVFYFYV